MSSTSTSSIEGSHLPDVPVFEKTPDNKIMLSDIFKGKKGILLGVAGAFTPECSSKHLPGFINQYEQLRSKGYDTIVCLSVNDVYAMQSWCENCNASGKVRFMADPLGDFTKAIHMDKVFPNLGLRCKRFTAIIEDGVVKKMFDEPDGMKVTVSSVDNVIQYLS